MSIKTLKFQALPEDYDETKERQSSTRKRKSALDSYDQIITNNLGKAPRRFKAANSKANFSLEYSYPAVIFDQVCFSVDRSQQQANFMQECLFKLKNCPLVGQTGGPNDNKVNILKSVNLNVPYGSIFGLLGPSSCGKTTLLRCLVGLLKPSSGSIRLFGHNLEACRGDGDNEMFDLGCLRGRRSKSTNDQRADQSECAQPTGKCQVPGINVGYMPQDLGLYEDFTIKQILTMFGRYMRMESKLIKQRIDFMARFLELPEIGRRIDSLSGGQKRRVSFAIACLHMPPLIILDEPTVGVDPLLRQSIWKYLRRLADEENKTIIITTHYIEEAAQADQVALMRAGEILVQDTPSKIMQLNQSKTLEEAFLRICNNVKQTDREDEAPRAGSASPGQVVDESGEPLRYKLYPQARFNWNQPDEFKMVSNISALYTKHLPANQLEQKSRLMEEVRMRAHNRSQLDDLKNSNRSVSPNLANCKQHNVKFNETVNRLSMAPNIATTTTENTNAVGLQDYETEKNSKMNLESINLNYHKNKVDYESSDCTNKTTKIFKRRKLVLNSNETTRHDCVTSKRASNLSTRLRGGLTLLWALLYKNYRRNVNSLPLLAFQFMLPVIQMISFSLCVGGRPTDIGLGLVNLDQPVIAASFVDNINKTLTNATIDYSYEDTDDISESLSLKYLSFIDKSMLRVINYDNKREALADVRRAKLWAVMEIGPNFTASISKRFDLDNFYQLELDTIHQSIIKLYPDRSNKILDMICHRSLVNSYRHFLLDHFEHFKRLPIEVREPIFDIKPNVISNSIDGYTESIAPGLLASLTYIMAAGLTTFIMVVERSAGILERTYTSGISPVAYLLAHAIFRSIVMMLQIGVVLILTFYVLKQPLVGSIWLAYAMLMTLNITGISYGLLISSIVTDQNGAALTIVSSLVVKITMSGILWPFEAIPNWLRIICYIQPLTMPVQALKAITLKGSSLGDRAVNLGFLVSISWFIVFLTISAKRFRFYQH